MPQIITYNDYGSGSLKITLSTHQQTDFTAYAVEYEKQILRDLLNDELQKAIYDAPSLTGKYKDLVDGCTYTDSDGDTRTNIGLKEVIKRYIYFYYRRDNYQVSSTGLNQNQNENAAQFTPAEAKQLLYNKLNEGIRYWNNDVLSFLDEYEIQEKAIDSYNDLGGSYRIYSADTGYLLNGDTVYINGAAYVITNFIANTSFDIQGTGLNLTGGRYLFYPFGTEEFTEQKLLWL